MDQERVVNERRALDDLAIIFRDLIAEALTDGPQSRGFRSDVDLLRKVGAVNDQRETLQSEIAWKVLVNELLERAPPTLILMWIARARGVEPDRVLPLLQGCNLVRFDKDDLCVRVNESSDQPRGRGPIHVDPFARCPFHDLTS